MILHQIAFRGSPISGIVADSFGTLLRWPGHSCCKYGQLCPSHLYCGHPPIFEAGFIKTRSSEALFQARPEDDVRMEPFGSFFVKDKVKIRKFFNGIGVIWRDGKIKKGEFCSPFLLLGGFHFIYLLRQFFGGMSGRLIS